MHNSSHDGADTEKGFTLTELLTVVLIIGVLAAIAVPSFIGSKKNGQDSHAQGNLRAVLGAERTYYVDFQAYTTSTTELRKLEPNLNFATTDAEAEGAMVALSGTNVFVGVSTSASGNQFCIMSIAQDVTPAVNGQTAAGTYYRKKDTRVSPPPTSATTADCGTTGYQTTSAGWR